MKFKSQKIIATTSLDTVISDLTNSLQEGVEWGNSVAIAFTATLLAIAVIRYLFIRD